MPKSEDSHYELDRVELMMAAVNIDSPVIPMPRLVESYMLDKLMTRIRLQPDGLETVINIMSMIEIDFPKYKDNWLHKTVLPGPLELIQSIQQRFNENSLTKDLFKYLYYDKLDINRCRKIYVFNIILSVFTVIVIFMAFKIQLYEALLVVILWMLSVYLQVKFFEYTMQYVCFTKVYAQIMNVIENHYNQHCAYVKRVIEIPQQIQERWQETEKQMIFDGMSAAEIENRKSLELKSGEKLQHLAAVVAINQATTDANIQKIKNETGLNYLEKELGIHDEIESKKRRHELLRSSVDAMGQFLVERGKALAEDAQEQRNIKYQLNLLKGIRSRDLSDESVYDAINQMMDMMTNSKSANDIDEPSSPNSKSVNDADEQPSPNSKSANDIDEQPST